MDISVVIPLLDEQDSLVELHDWIAQVMQSNQLNYEIIFIDDGSRDNSWSIIKKLSTKNFKKRESDTFYSVSAPDFRQV